MEQRVGTHRQTDRQEDRQADSQTDRQSDRPTILTVELKPIKNCLVTTSQTQSIRKQARAQQPIRNHLTAGPCSDPITIHLAAGQGSAANPTPPGSRTGLGSHQTPPGNRPGPSSQSEPTWLSVDRFLLVGAEAGVGEQGEEMPPTPLLLTGGGPPLPAHHLLPARLPRLPLLTNQGAGDGGRHLGSASLTNHSTHRRSTFPD